MHAYCVLLNMSFSLFYLLPNDSKGKKSFHIKDSDLAVHYLYLWLQWYYCALSKASFQSFIFSCISILYHLIISAS